MSRTNEMELVRLLMRLGKSLEEDRPYDELLSIWQQAVAAMERTEQTPEAARTLAGMDRAMAHLKRRIEEQKNAL